MPELSSHAANPFSAARLRPGTIDFVFGHGESLSQIVDALQANQWRGEITGQHGTGKSTLLTTMIPAIEARGRIVLAVTLTEAQNALPPEFFTAFRHTAGLGVAVIDGFEQLSLWQRLRLKRLCKVGAGGLLLATHRSARLTEIYRTAINVPRAWKVVERLQIGYAPLVGISDLVERLAQRRGNLREALFDLYDLYEARRET